MGYQLNFFAQYHNPDTQFIIVTSDSLNIWGKEDASALSIMDRDFEEKNGVSVIRLNAILTRETKNNIWLCGLIKTLRKLKPDLLFVHCVESYSALRIVLRRRKFKGCTICFDTHTLRNQFLPGGKFRIYQWVIRNVIGRRINRHGMRAIGTTRENCDILKTEYGIRPQNILYVPIGTDLATFKFSLSERKNLRDHYGFRKEDIVLLYTGKMNMKKKPHLILEAIKLVEQKISLNLQIVFVGGISDSYRAKIQEGIFKNQRINLTVLPAVPINELYKIYSMADFVVFPLENTLSSLDAQACRLPVIMEINPTNEERLEKGGLLYRKNDLDDLAGKILDMIHNPELRTRLGSGGEAYIREKYNYKELTSQLEKELGIGNYQI